MSIFISHVEENRGTAEEIARGLQEQGYEAWSYETDTLPGPTYLSQVVDAIESASAMILIISPESLGSHQVAREIDVAHEMDRPIIPVLKDITHEKYIQRRPEWRLALGAYTSIAIPSEGVAAIMPRIVRGLEALGSAPGEAPRVAVPPTPPATRFQRARAGARRRPWTIVLVGAVLLAVLGLVSVLLVTSGGSKPAVSGTPRSSPNASVPAVPANASRAEATLSGVPSTVLGGQKFTLSYSITNKSESNIDKASTSILVEIAPNVQVGPAPIAGGGVDLADISQNIAAGSTVKGSIPIDVSGAPLGPTTVFIDMGTRLAGNSTTDDQVVAVAPTIVKG
jgi:hypothetical protein